MRSPPLRTQQDKRTFGAKTSVEVYYLDAFGMGKASSFHFPEGSRIGNPGLCAAHLRRLPREIRLGRASRGCAPGAGVPFSPTSVCKDGETETQRSPGLAICFLIGYLLGESKDWH